MDFTNSFNNITNSKVTVKLPAHKTPRQLTSKLGKDTIVGREKELEEINTLLKEPNSLLLINGIGGIGKSTIASYYLHSQKERLGYYGFFEGLESFTSELREPLALQQEKENDAFMEALSKLRNLKGNKLLVVDDVKEIENNQDKIEKILALKDSGYKILFTSREEIEDVEQYYLDVLSLKDAKELFNSIYPVEDEELLEEILEYLDYHAFFIEKTAHSIKTTLTPQMIRDKFKDGDFCKISVKRKQNFNQFLNQLFNLDKLDDEEILMLKQLSVLPSIEIDFQFLQEIFDKKDDEEFEEILNYLCEKGWLNYSNKSYKLHQIVKEYIWKFDLPSFEEIEIVFSTFSKFILNSVSAEVASIIQNNIIYYSSLNLFLKKISILNKEVALYYLNFGNINEKLKLNEEALKFYKSSLSIYSELKDDSRVHSIHNGIANCYYNMSAYQESIKYDRQALAIRIRLKIVPSLTAQSYSHLASSYSILGQREKASKYFEKSLKLIEDIEVDNVIKIGIYNLSGMFFRDEGNLERALNLLLECKELYKESSLNADVATIHFNLAEIYLELKNYQKAEKLYLQALEIKKQSYTGNHPDIAQSYGGLAKFYLTQNKLDKAIEYSDDALKIFLSSASATRNHFFIGSFYTTQGHIYEKKGEHSSAIQSYFNALEIFDNINKNSYDSAICYRNIGVSNYNRGNFKDAFIFIQKALDIFEQNNKKEYEESLKILINMHSYLESKQVTLNSKIGRNKLCPCNSGKKYKKCCGKNS